MVEAGADSFYDLKECRAHSAWVKAVLVIADHLQAVELSRFSMASCGGTLTSQLLDPCAARIIRDMS